MAMNEAEVRAADPAAATARFQLREMLVAKAPDKVGAYDNRSLSEFDALVFVCFAVIGKPPAAEGGEVNATDAARALAADNDIDLADVEGTGVGGRIIIDDVQAAIEARDSA